MVISVGTKYDYDNSSLVGGIDTVEGFLGKGRSINIDPGF